METTSFVLGILSIIGAIAIATIVWGIVKINKLSTAIKYHEEYNTSGSRMLWENMQSQREELDRRVSEVDQHAAEQRTRLQQGLDSRIDELIRYSDQNLREFDRTIDNRFDQFNAYNKSYTDKRFDKLVESLSEKKSKKELING